MPRKNWRCRVASVPFDKTTTAMEIRKKTRYFQLDWLDKRSWLVYCKTENKAYGHISANV